MRSRQWGYPVDDDTFNPNEFTDRELLVHIYRTVYRLDKIVTGNGQPGLETRVSRLEGAALPQKVTLIGGIAGVFGAGIAALVDFVVKQRVG